MKWFSRLKRCDFGFGLDVGLEATRERDTSIEPCQNGVSSHGKQATQIIAKDMCMVCASAVSMIVKGKTLIMAKGKYA